MAIIVYKNGKRFKEFKNHYMKNMYDIKMIYQVLMMYRIKKFIVHIPTMNEEPLQYILRKNGFTLQGY